jgi:hypothetical protein
MARRPTNYRAEAGGRSYDNGYSSRYNRSRFVYFLTLFPILFSSCVFFSHSPPRQTRYRMIVENLSTRFTWAVCLFLFLRTCYFIMFDIV